jgi:transmembrane sensor
MKKEYNFSLFWEMTGRILTGEAGEKEHKQYHEMLLSSQELLDSYVFLKANWHKMYRLGLFNQVNTKEDWLKVKQKIEDPGRETPLKAIIPLQRFRRVLPYAAAVAVFVVVGSLLFFPASRQALPDVVLTTIQAPLGSRANIVLPDGSDVWLNAGSILEYNTDFMSGDRQVKLTGEAFFEVKKGDHPFIVNTPEINIRVLGTSFNIKAYEEDDYIEATLVTGSLVIEKARQSGPQFDDIVLKPNQKVTFYKKAGNIALNDSGKAFTEGSSKEQLTSIPRPVISGIKIQNKKDVDSEVGWKNGMLVVEREPLRLFVKRLERRYDVTFVFDDENLKDYNYTGQMQEVTLEQVLHAMKITSPIDYSIIDKTVTLRENKDSSYKYQKITRKPNE